MQYMQYSQHPLNLAAISAGCGTGNYLVAVSDFVGKVTGVEVNEGMLVQAKKKTAHLAIMWTFTMGIFSPSPFLTSNSMVFSTIR